MHSLLLLLRSNFSFLLIILSPAYSVLADDQNYQDCSSQVIQCGNLNNVGYPFWGMNRPAYCGYPGFELNCTDDEPEITIMSQKYRLLRIDGGSNIITVARVDYLENLCPTNHSNNTINRTLFQDTPSDDTANVTLYYRCNPITITNVNSYFNMFSCSGFALNYYTTLNLADFGPQIQFVAVRLCRDTVILPAMRSQVENLGSSISLTPDNLVRTLASGFPLQWSANNSLCDDCRDTDGECGYNTDSGQFRCFCSDGEDNVGGLTCPRRKTGNGSKLALGLGIGGGVIALLLVFGVLIAIKRTKRNAVQSKSSNELSLPTSKPPASPSLRFDQRTYSNHYSKSAVERGSSYFGAQVFSYSELAAATDNFNTSKQLGDGGFGAVYLGILSDGREVAAKRLYEKNFKRVEQFMNEVAILTRLHHPNLVQLYGCTSRHSRELILVYEYIPNGTVADHLHGSRARSGFLSWPVRLSIAVETASALLYLHMSDIIHRDVKTNNILLDSYFHVKVADFGLSRLFPNDVTHVSTAPQGTPGYVDPEYYRCFKLTDKSDVYSFGVVLVELLSGKEAVDTNRHRDDVNLANMAMIRIQNHALHELVDPSLGFEADNNVRRMIISVAELAFRCLQQDRDMRPSMEEVLEMLKDIQSLELGSQRAEVIDIRSADDVGLLKQISPPLSPDTVAATKLQRTV